MNVIKVRNACKQYQSIGDTKLAVLNGFNMNVERGSIYAMMGSSGSGKTTLLSCLVGITSLDSGEIELFGEPFGTTKKTRIGYMPQEISLISGFTVREMIYFFGIIAGMSDEKIREKFQFLSKLLELPDKDRLTRDCSGGQQRRISFAACLVHDPEILILDEPTVGLDPLLREKIWDYLVDLSQTKKVTVLLTTHYIEEAGQATSIGLMRNGVQIAEDSPQNILQMYETTSLEDAFVKMSERQEAGLPPRRMINDLEVVETSDSGPSKYTRHHRNSLKAIQEQTTSKILKALLMKHFLEIVRHFGIFCVTLFIPVLGCLNLHFGVGGQIKGLTLGIVNQEVMDMSECFNKSLITYELRDSSCFLHKTSCRFISELNNFEDIKYYKSFDEAYRDVKKGELMGIIEFASNYTDSLLLFSNEEILGDKGIENYFTDNGNVQITLDQTDLQKTSQIQRRLYDIYQTFMEGLMTDCKLSKKAGNIPIVYEEFFGKVQFDFKLTLVPGMLIMQLFAFSSYLTSMSIISERVDGTWNRALVAGVKPNHFIISHLIEGMIICLLQFVSNFIYTVFILAPRLTMNTAVLMTSILLMEGIAGVAFGLFVSVVTDSVMASFVVAQIFVYPASFISGIIWPMQGMPSVLQFIGYLFPFAYSAAAVKAILVKDITVYYHDAYMALVVAAVWIVASITLSFWFIKRKK